MNQILKRMEAFEPLPQSDTDSVMIFDQASALFGYKVPQNEKRRKSEFLRTKLQELNIFPFTNESVWEYQMAAVTAKTLEKAERCFKTEKTLAVVVACVPLLIAIVFLITAIFFFEQKTEVRVFTAVAAITFGIVSLRNFWKYKKLKISDLMDHISVRWDEKSLDGYGNRIPVDVLEMAVLIKKTVTEATFTVEEMEDYADPFLVVKLGHEVLYIACYEYQGPPSLADD
ncbi:MAG: hypothetical protein WC810_26360 [Janthinobacterium sp.]|jgi:hypothetical protein